MHLPAALLVFAGAAAVIVSWFGGVPDTEPRLATVSAPPGHPVQLSLPDGSEVMLGPGSTLEYSRAMTAETDREVHLDGEAYFGVAPEVRQPLEVHAGNLTTALRAEAVVRAYPEDEWAHVVVRKGQAVLAGHVVGAGEVGWLAEPDRPAIVAADTSAWFAWTKGRLAFTDAFRNVIPRLSRWYDLDLRVADSALGAVVLVATLPDTMTEDALQAIAFALSARLERHDRQAIFHAGDAPSP